MCSITALTLGLAVGAQAQSSLGEALDAPELTWTTGGAAGWFAQEQWKVYGEAAAQSGSIGDGEQSWLETTVQGPGFLTFWWKVGSEAGYDWLELRINGQVGERISGQIDWRLEEFHLPYGSHTLRWRYAKDANWSVLPDAGWLDDVYFFDVSESVAPVIVTHPAGARVDLGSSVTLSVGLDSVSSEPIEYQWRSSGIDIPGATDPIYTIPSFSILDGGVYSVLVSNIAGSAVSQDAFLQPNTPPILLAHWDFNDTSDPARTVDIINGFAAVITGEARFSDQNRDGNPGDHVMDFGPNNENAVVRVDDAQFLNIAGALDGFTVSFWMKRTGPLNSGSAFWMIAEGMDRAAQAHVPYNDGVVYFDTGGGSTAGTHRISAHISTFDGSPGVEFLDDWHHYALIKNVADKQIWIDGHLFLDGVNPAHLPKTFTTLYIASRASLLGINGLVDDFALFAGALDPAQVLELASGTSPASLNGVITALPTDPGAPAEFTRISIDGQHVLLEWTGPGTLQAAPAVTGPWTNLDGLTRPASIPLDAPQRFLRIAQ